MPMRILRHELTENEIKVLKLYMTITLLLVWQVSVRSIDELAQLVVPVEYLLPFLNFPVYFLCFIVFAFSLSLAMNFVSQTQGDIRRMVMVVVSTFVKVLGFLTFLTGFTLIQTCTSVMRTHLGHGFLIKHRIIHAYTHNSRDLTHIDTVQRNFSCCGAMSYIDFIQDDDGQCPFKGEDLWRCQVPPSCARRDSSRPVCLAPKWYSLPKKAVNFPEGELNDTINTIGCLENIYERRLAIAMLFFRFGGILIIVQIVTSFLSKTVLSYLVEFEPE